MPLRKPAKGESQSDWMSFCMGELKDSETERPHEQMVAICMSAWREEHGGEKPSKSIEQMIAEWNARQVVPEQDEDRSEFVYRCVHEEGLDRQTCIAIWDNYRSTEATVTKTHVSEGTGREFILSDNSVDRLGDVIEASGWDLHSFEKNPVMLFNHNSDFPLGRWTNLRVVGNELRGTPHFAAKGTSSRIDEIRSLVEQDILRAVSVGFRPLKHEPLGHGKGLRYLQQVLLECSIVSVPANANALAVAKNLKISDATMKMVFGKQAEERSLTITRPNSGKHAANPSSVKRNSNMTPLTKRIEDAQERLVAAQDELTKHLDSVDDTNVSDAQLETTNALTENVDRCRKSLDALKEAEQRIAKTVESSEDPPQTVTRGGTAMVLNRGGRPFASPAGPKLRAVDYMWRALTCQVKHFAEDKTRPILDVIRSTYGEDECTRVMYGAICTRADTVPATTTTAGWAAELVTTGVAEFMESLQPVSIYPQLAARGGRFTFGRNGVVTIPYREATPTIGGAFVLQGSPIPVKQAAFNAITLTPKKMGVISTFTREIAEHSTPAIEGLIRQAVLEDTATAIDSILLDATAASATRPAGLRNGVVALGPTGGGAVLAAVIGDLTLMINALQTSTSGNFRSPVWLIRPGDRLIISFMPTATSGDMPFKDELARGTLAGIPVIESTSVTADTMYLIDAADFVSATGDAPRFSVSDQAVLHMEDTTPLEIVSGTGPTTADPVRSLWQTDTLAVRMLLDINWAMRRTGMVQFVTSLGWN